MIKFQVRDHRNHPVGPLFESFTDAYSRWQYEMRTVTTAVGDPYVITEETCEDVVTYGVLGAVLVEGGVVFDHETFETEDQRDRFIGGENRALGHRATRRWASAFVTLPAAAPGYTDPQPAARPARGRFEGVRIPRTAA